MSNYNGQFQDTGANILLPTPHSYANIEGSTASQAYVKGQMLVYNNRLCQVIAPISSGNTLTIGTNIAYKNVGDIGKQLVASDGKGFYFDVKDGSYGFYPSASKVASEFVPFGGSTGIVVVARSVGIGAYDNSMGYFGYDKDNDVTYDWSTANYGIGTYYDFFTSNYSNPSWTITLLRPAYVRSQQLNVDGEYNSGSVFRWNYGQHVNIMFFF